jgi:hypothetical protein
VPEMFGEKDLSAVIEDSFADRLDPRCRFDRCPFEETTKSSLFVEQAREEKERLFRSTERNLSFTLIE